MSGLSHSHAGAALLVRHAPVRLAAHRYILDMLLGEHLGISYQIEQVPGLQGVEIRCPAAGQGEVLLGSNLLLQPEADWLAPRSMPALPLSYWEPQPTVPAWELAPVPIIYPPSVQPPSSLGRPGTLSLPLDLLGGAFFLLTRYEELVVQSRDRHRRFPAAESIVYKADLLLRPVVDEYGLLLRLALAQCFPGLRFREQRPRLRFSHDIDHPFQFFGKPLHRSFLAAAKRIGRRPTRGATWRALRTFLRARPDRNFSTDPFNTYSSLMEASEALGMPAEFYFMTASNTGRYEESYDLSTPELQSLLRQIHDRGHVIGLHPSYGSFRSEAVLASELATLLKAAAQAGIRLQALGGRQHYLRWELPTTWRCWDNLGLSYDSTLGFPEQIGFRCGTAHEFPAFDPTRCQRLNLRERPLIAMDVTLSDYLGLAPESVLFRLEQLWDTISLLGGTLEILLHNCNPMAVRLAKALAGLKPTGAPLRAGEPSASCPDLRSQTQPQQPCAPLPG